jgi:Bacterial PH domain
VKTLVRMTERGLPGPIPDGERLLWQGAPSFWGMATRALHLRLAAAWFVFAMSWRFGAALLAGDDLVQATAQATVLLIPMVLCLAILAGLAAAYAKTTFYAMTTHRVIIRSGVALPATVNVPFKSIEQVAFRRYRDGSGDIPLKLVKGQRIAWLLLWPSIRPWRFLAPEPMLRGLAEPEKAARILAEALKLAHPEGAAAMPQTVQDETGSTAEAGWREVPAT